MENLRKKLKLHIARIGGFTMMEVVIAMVIVTVASLVVLNTYREEVAKSHKPIIYVRNMADLASAMARMNVDYESNSVKDLAVMNSLKDKFTASATLYGSNFSVVTNTFIKFTGAPIVEQTVTSGSDPEYGKNLKVVIKNSEGGKLTLLMTQK